MKPLIALITVIFCFALRGNPIYSQKRPLNVDYRQILNKIPVGGPDNAYSLKDDFSKIDLQKIPVLKDYLELREIFRRVRDTRFLKTTSPPNFMRRSSWLYPDDGCYARGSLARKNIEDWKYLTPKKIFIFGNLEVQTPNAEPGEKSVGWTYHVVPVYRVQNKAYVIDPAIEPKEPLELNAWVLRMVSKVEDATFTLCNEYTYHLFGNCLAAVAADEKNALTDQYTYLEDEWNRLVNLKRDPNQELGETPPWQ